MAHLSRMDAVAAGVRSLPDLATPLAATQAAWRFYANEHLSLRQLAEPLIHCVRSQIPKACDEYVLVAMDWSGLHLSGHLRRADRVELYRATDLGYELLTALALSDRDGRPLAPLALELKAKEGLYSTRSFNVLPACSPLDNLAPLMAHLGDLELGKPPVFIIDRQADSVGHFRQFLADGRLFLIRAKDNPKVCWRGEKLSLAQVADKLEDQQPLVFAGEVQFKGKPARQHVGATGVTLSRPARSFRYYGKGKHRVQRHKNVAGQAIILRLIVSVITDAKGKVLARWLLLSNLPEKIAPSTVARWYYWRWRIESFHKLIKGAGLHLEHWQQETASAFSRRLLVAAMAVTLVWQLAANPAPQAQTMRHILVRLSGRQIKRGKTLPTFTIPALLAGMGVLLPMMELLEHHSPEELRALLRQTLPFMSALDESG